MKVAETTVEYLIAQQGILVCRHSIEYLGLHVVEFYVTKLSHFILKTAFVAGKIRDVMQKTMKYLW